MPRLSALRSSQPRGTAVLEAALQSGRMHHSYLLVGPEESETQAVALAAAQALVCTARQGADACENCIACKKFEGKNHPDVIQIQPNEKGSITIEQVREATARLGLRAAESAVKIVLVWTADAMNPAAQNALLKTLEEPPGATCFFLMAKQKRALLPTVRSRTLALRLAPRDRLTAWQTLAEQGTDPALARLLGPIAGADAPRVAELLELGATEIWQSLTRVVDPKAESQDLLAVAADLGQARERADLALQLLEVYLRDALAARHGAPPELRYTEEVAKAGLDLDAGAARLMELRRLVVFHVNRTLALEATLLDVTHKTS